MTNTIISLSTIPSRFKSLGPTLRSLLDQSLPAREIRLNIPTRYRRFPDWDGQLPDVPTGITIHRCERDFGPATKLLPTIAAVQAQDVDILVCDDDKIYDRGWHARFKAQAAKRPGTCIVEVGETFPDIADSVRPADRLPRARRARKDLYYRMIRIATLTLYKPRLYRNSGFVDQISGYGGVLVRPDWFDAEIYDIPGVLWTVDDPWISGQLERMGIPIWLNGKGRIPGFGAAGRVDALLDLVEEGHGRVEADLAAIAHMRQAYRIWQPGGKPDDDFSRMTASMKALARRRQEELAKGSALPAAEV